MPGTPHPTATTGGLASAVVGVLCWLKVLLGLSGPLSISAPLPYRTLVVVLLPLVIGTWLHGLSHLPSGRARSVARAGVGTAWIGVGYVVLVGLEQYFLNLLGVSMPWAAAGYLLVTLGVLLVGIAVLTATTLPVWSRALPLALGVPLPLLMLAELSGALWTSAMLVVGVGFLVLSGVLTALPRTPCPGAPDRESPP